MRKQRRRSASRFTAKLISAFVFATRIVRSLCFLNPKFQASSRLLWLHGRFVSDLVGNPEDQFSHNEGHMYYHFIMHNGLAVFCCWLCKCEYPNKRTIQKFWTNRSWQTLSSGFTLFNSLCSLRVHYS